MAKEKKYHHGNLKEALIENGLAILEETGIEGLSLRTLAERTGVSHTAPKNHFGNIAGLHTAIATVGYKRLAAAMTENVAEDATQSDRRNAAFEGYVRFAKAQPGLFELMFSKRRTNSDDPDLLSAARTCFDVLRDGAEGLVWDKAETVNAELRAQMMYWSLVHGFAQLHISGHFQKEGFNALDILDIVPAFQHKA
ncbi:TetR/AcrR family transcriptional regulator [Rhizobium sp. L1K21]|uniref:TetR/AcrR family transcriptional regulator n=1 Tax=Rhizobium sp. L1K21 TaxID=2954933 RepID=UPI0020927835|nr:TetR/AcrR family transcriptional regulator [Rhizobium sp. L1K21]MCO6186596.1 TetR/AcrR family transcriptional regulator [Rhizobium sp. L1K21]